MHKGNDLETNLSTIYPSPTSSLESSDNKIACDESAWLMDNDLDVWLANDIDPQFSIKEEPLSPEHVTWSTADSSTTDLLGLMNSTELLQTVNKPINDVIKVSTPSPPVAVTSVKTTQSVNSKNIPVKVKTLKSPTNTKVRPILPSVTVAARRAENIEANLASNNLNTTAFPNPLTGKVIVSQAGIIQKPAVTQQPQIVKLENGQYYVAPVLPQNSQFPTNGTPAGIIAKPCLKRPADMKTSSLYATAHDVSEYKNMKRQQRMMKNRESACLSRQRKKEHLKSLEQRVAEITEMNSKLKEENESLKQRIQSLECENKELKERPASNLLKRNAKKSTFLLAVFVLFSLNLFRFSNVNIGVTHQSNKVIPAALIHKSRTLLNYDNSNINFYDDSFTKNADALSFNKALPHDILDNFQKKDDFFRLKKFNPKLRKFNGMNDKEFDDISWNVDNDIDCGDSFNKTHLNRINKDLEGLAKGIDKSKRKIKNAHGLSGNTTDQTEKDCNKVHGRKRIFPKLKKPLKHSHSRIFRNIKSKSLTPKISKEKNVTQELVSLIQKNIRRKADTFYVVSLLQDMMILPATNFSTNQRPKVTFLLPAYLPTNDTKVKSDEKLPILQIECNVADTKLLHLESSYFSENLLTQIKSF